MIRQATRLATTSRTSLARRTFSVKVCKLTATPGSIEYAEGPVLGGDVSKIISGSPTTKTAIQHAGLLVSGTWECEVGKWSHEQSGDEYVNLLEGTMILENEDGAENYSAHDTFVIPDGWVGTWEVTAPLKKFFVVKGS